MNHWFLADYIETLFRSYNLHYDNPHNRMKTMFILFRSFFDICIFKKSPQDIPASSQLLALCMFTYIASSIILTLTFQDVGNAGISGLVDLFLVLVITYILLSIKRLPERWLQTSSALLGVGTIFGLLAMPFYLVLSVEGIDGSNNFVLSMGVFSLIIWNISVMAHIFRHALNILYAGGIIISLMYVFIISSIIVAIAPREGL